MKNKINKIIKTKDSARYAIISKEEKMEYLTGFKFPHASYYNPRKDNFIENIAEQSISVAKNGRSISPEAYAILESHGKMLIRQANESITVSEENARVFDLVWTAIQLHLANEETGQIAQTIKPLSKNSVKEEP